MIIQRMFYRAALVAIFLLALPTTSFACRCPNSTPASAYQRADAVLWGKVIDVQGDINKEGAIAKISVSRAWKKKVHDEVIVSTATTCAFEFQLGEEYIIYLYESPDGKYTTKKCVGNLPISRAGKVLDWLKRRGAPMTVEHLP